MNDRISTTILASLFIAGASTIASAAPFTYQGSLQDSGAPADGEYDLRFELYNSAIGGSQIGPTLNFNDVQVTQGTFQVEVDFGNAFNDSPAFIFIEVRDGASNGGYTGLLPRSPITATPKAQHATTADELSNPLWERFSTTLTNTDSTDILLLNRTKTITTNEVFGIFGNIPGFVGMYSAGPVNSKPFYGYSVAGETSAFSYFDSVDDTWRLRLGFDEPIVAERNNIIAGDKVIANDFEYKAPKTSYASVMGDSFYATSDDPFFASVGNAGGYISSSGSGTMVAPIQLPHGAVITKFRAYFTDNSASSSLIASLQRRFHAGSGLLDSATTSTSGFSGTRFLVETTSISVPEVDNDRYSYQLRVFSNDWIGDGSLRIESVVVEYTTTQAD